MHAVPCSLTLLIEDSLCSREQARFVHRAEWAAAMEGTACSTVELAEQPMVSTVNACLTLEQVPPAVHVCQMELMSLEDSRGI